MGAESLITFVLIVWTGKISRGYS